MVVIVATDDGCTDNESEEGSGDFGCSTKLVISNEASSHAISHPRHTSHHGLHVHPLFVQVCRWKRDVFDLATASVVVAVEEKETVAVAVHSSIEGQDKDTFTIFQCEVPEWER